MSQTAEIAWDDTVLPFQLDHADVRGRIARLDGTLQGVLSQHDYPPQVEALVAEVALLTALLGQTMKLRWKLSLQIRGNGPVRILAADYFAPPAEGEAARIRAWASFDGDRLDTSATPFSQIGQGYFAILIDQGEGTQPYQGITPLEKGSLSACAETYFEQSEQLPTRFRLAYGRSRMRGAEAERWRAGGLMVQHLPSLSGKPAGGAEHTDLLAGASSAADDAAAEDWSRVGHLMATVEDLELIGPTVSPTELLVRLFHEEAPRVFDPQAVRFGCTCSADKVRQSLSIYSAKDIRTMTTPEGIVTADCQFCGRHYEFDPATLGFEATVPVEGPEKGTTAEGTTAEGTAGDGH